MKNQIKPLIVWRNLHFQCSTYLGAYMAERKMDISIVRSITEEQEREMVKRGVGFIFTN